MLVSGNTARTELGSIKADKKENYLPHEITAEALKSDKIAEKYKSTSAALEKPLRNDNRKLTPPPSPIPSPNLHC
ncbi:hypothetical protein SUGI_0338770 [Cryptomeria japonica]|nr:hypothetical protein SUGI_0338770 [Cryptomeria japonica]